MSSSLSSWDCQKGDLEHNYVEAVGYHTSLSWFLWQPSFQCRDNTNNSHHGKHLQKTIDDSNTERLDTAMGLGFWKFALHCFGTSTITAEELTEVNTKLRVRREDCRANKVWRNWTNHNQSRTIWLANNKPKYEKLFGWLINSFWTTPHSRISSSLCSQRSSMATKIRS